jgi:hypothetical protein
MNAAAALMTSHNIVIPQSILECKNLSENEHAVQADRLDIVA